MAEAEKVIPAATHEQADVTKRFILGAVGLMLGGLAIVTLGVLIAFPMPHLDRTRTAPLPVYPEPRLQTDPRQDMARFHAEQMQRLNSVGWVDKAAGIVHIPIADAMREIARDGIPGWPAQSGKQP